MDAFPMVLEGEQISYPAFTYPAAYPPYTIRVFLYFLFSETMDIYALHQFIYSYFILQVKNAFEPLLPSCFPQKHPH